MRYPLHASTAIQLHTRTPSHPPNQSPTLPPTTTTTAPPPPIPHVHRECHSADMTPLRDGQRHRSKDLSPSKAFTDVMAVRHGTNQPPTHSRNRGRHATTHWCTDCPQLALNYLTLPACLHRSVSLANWNKKRPIHLAMW